MCDIEHVTNIFYNFLGKWDYQLLVNATQRLNSKVHDI